MQIAFNRANEKAAALMNGDTTINPLHELYEVLIFEFGGWLQIGNIRCPTEPESFQGEIRKLLQAPHFQVDNEWYILDPDDSFRLIDWSILGEYVARRKRQQDQMKECEACFFHNCNTHDVEPLIPGGVIAELLDEEQWFAKVLLLLRNQIEGTSGSTG